MTRGFSLIETLIAVAILTSGLTAALGLLSFVLRTVKISTNGLIAAHLAAEGVEVIRNLRDANWLRRDVGGEARVWRDELGAGRYEAQYDTVLPVPAFGDRFLEIAPDGRYCYGCGARTLFKRRIDIAWIDIATPRTERMRVKATVLWQDQFASREVVVEDVLYDWK